METPTFKEVAVELLRAFVVFSIVFIPMLLIARSPEVGVWFVVLVGVACGLGVAIGKVILSMFLRHAPPAEPNTRRGAASESEE